MQLLSQKLHNNEDVVWVQIPMNLLNSTECLKGYIYVHNPVLPTNSFNIYGIKFCFRKIQVGSKHRDCPRTVFNLML